jgi:hypothetical protein
MSGLSAASLFQINLHLVYECEEILISPQGRVINTDGSTILEKNLLKRFP